MAEGRMSPIQALTKIVIFRDGRLAFSNVAEDWLEFMNQIQKNHPHVQEMLKLRRSAQGNRRIRRSLQCLPPKK